MCDGKLVNVIHDVDYLFDPVHLSLSTNDIAIRAELRVLCDEIVSTPNTTRVHVVPDGEACDGGATPTIDSLSCKHASAKSFAIRRIAIDVRDDFQKCSEDVGYHVGGKPDCAIPQRPTSSTALTARSATELAGGIPAVAVGQRHLQWRVEAISSRALSQ